MNDPEEFQELLDRWNEDGMNAADLQRFEAMLEDEGLRRILVRDFVDGALLAEALKQESASTARVRARGEVKALGRGVPGFWHGMVQMFQAWPWKLAAAAVCSFILVLWFRAGRQDLPMVNATAGVEILRNGTPIGRGDGQRLRAGDIVRSTAGVQARLLYRDGTSVALNEAAEVRIDGGSAKMLRLISGTVKVSAAKQPPGFPMVLATSDTKATIVGTRFTLTAHPGASWLAVDEGAVRFLPQRSAASEVLVTAQHYSVASGDLDAAPAIYDPVTGAPNAVAIPVDWTNSSFKGDGNWRIEKGNISQQKLSDEQSRPVLWSTPKDPTSTVDIDCAAAGSILVDTDIQVDRLPDDNRWYGIALRMGFGQRLVKLNFIGDGPLGAKLQITVTETQPPSEGDEFALAKVEAFNFGLYHIKMLYTRLDSGHVRISGKLWSGNEEPAAWMAQADAPLADPVRRFGLETTHCACTFREYKAMLVK